jgi:hypothetical protein
MAEKLMFIQVTKQCIVAGKECGVGSVVEVPASEGKYVIGLKKATESKGPAKHVPIVKAKPESKAAEPK